MQEQSIIQVQPAYATGKLWMDFADKEHLSFEILELSARYLNESATQEVVSWYHNSGKVHSIHGAFMDNYPLSPDEQIREVSRRRCEQSCEYAKMTGAKNVVFHSTDLPFCRNGLEDVWAKQAAEYYQDLAEKYQLKIWIENFNDPDPVSFRKMMQHVETGNVGICLDAGHANFSRTDLNTWLEMLSPWIGYLHLSDNMGQWDDHMAVGTGTVDFQTLDAWYRREQRQMPITLEVKTMEGLQKSIDYLKSNQMFGLKPNQ